MYLYIGLFRCMARVLQLMNSQTCKTQFRQTARLVDSDRRLSRLLRGSEGNVQGEYQDGNSDCIWGSFGLVRVTDLDSPTIWGSNVNEWSLRAEFGQTINEIRLHRDPTNRRK